MKDKRTIVDLPTGKPDHGFVHPDERRHIENQVVLKEILIQLVTLNMKLTEMTTTGGRGDSKGLMVFGMGD